MATNESENLAEVKQHNFDISYSLSTQIFVYSKEIQYNHSYKIHNIYSHGFYFHRVVCLFVLRFYGPVNPMGSCRARSVYLTRRLLGRLSPLSG